MKKEIKGFVIGSIATFILTASVGFATGTFKTVDVYENNVSIYANGNQVDAPNFTYNDTTYVPLRAISENLNCNVDYDNDTKTVTLKNGSTSGQFDTKVIGYKISLSNKLISFLDRLNTWSRDISSDLYMCNRYNDDMYFWSRTYGDATDYLELINTMENVMNTLSLNYDKLLAISDDVETYRIGKSLENTKTYISEFKTKMNEINGEVILSQDDLVSNCDWLVDFQSNVNLETMTLTESVYNNILINLTK